LKFHHCDWYCCRVPAAVTRGVCGGRVAHCGHHQHASFVQRRVPSAVRLHRAARHRSSVSPPPPTRTPRRQRRPPRRVRRQRRRRRRSRTQLRRLYETAVLSSCCRPTQALSLSSSLVSLQLQRRSTHTYTIRTFCMHKRLFQISTRSKNAQDE